MEKNHSSIHLNTKRKIMQQDHFYHIYTPKSLVQSFHKNLQVSIIILNLSYYKRHVYISNNLLYISYKKIIKNQIKIYFIFVYFKIIIIILLHVYYG